MVATPIKDIFDSILNTVPLNKDDVKERYAVSEKYGFSSMSICAFIDDVLADVDGKKSALSIFNTLVKEYGLMVYGQERETGEIKQLTDMELKELLDSLNEREKPNLHTLYTNRDYYRDFWINTQKKRSYQVLIDDVARCYFLAGKSHFPWFHAFTGESLSIEIPYKTKTDNEQSSAGNIEGNTKGNNERVSTPSNKSRTRRTNLSKAIDSAIETLGKKPSFDELWQFFQDDKDTTGNIEDFTDTHITWKDTKGKLHDTKKETIKNQLSQR
jgi:hypothetical protein